MQVYIRKSDPIYDNIYFPPQVNASFRCTYEGMSDCILKQSIDDNENWRLLPAGVDDSLGGFDHTSLSGKRYQLQKSVDCIQDHNLGLRWYIIANHVNPW